MSMERRAFLLGASTLATGAMASGPASTSEIGSPASAEYGAGALPPKGGQSLFAHVNGVRLHYVRVGEGPNIVLLHGWPQTWFAWRDTMERLCSRFTLIAPDLRGLGLSERTAGGYDKQTIAKDIRTLIDEAAGGRAHVVGHDMGGKAAFMLACFHPEHVEKLVLVDCLIPGTENMDALRGGAWHYGFHMAPVSGDAHERARARLYRGADPRLVA
ncbi:alpha/beta hydrolase [Methylocystis sp. 9N]|uniref:Alpha/beta hydrolase n=1 Tax=Methylocystis borbori TaxID=3118750 RepID=A0ABU7XCK7_9HYPH